MSEEYTYRIYYNGTTPFDEYVDSPAGWDKAGISFIRNKRYHSVLRSAILSIRFDRRTGGGGEYLKLAYDEAGLYAEVFYEMYKRNPDTDDYDLFYNGIFDYKKYKLYRDFVEIAVIDGSKQEKLITRDNIDYNLRDVISTDNINITPFANTPKDITFKGIDILLSVESTVSIIVNDFDIINDQGYYYFTDYFILGLPTPSTLIDKIIPFISESITLNEIGDRLLTTDGGDTGDVPSDRTLKIYENTTNYDSVIYTGGSQWVIHKNTIRFQGAPSNATHVYLYVEVHDEDSNVLTHHLIYSQTIPASVEFDYTPLNLNLYNINNVYTSHSVPVGGSLNLFFSYELIGTITQNYQWAYWVRGSELIMDVNFTEISPSIGDTTAECFYPYEAFSRLIQLSTSETDTSKLLYSEILGRYGGEFRGYLPSGDAAYIAITNGFALRKFLNRAINVNLRDLFQSFDSIYNLGLGFDRVNDRFYISPKSDFYDETYLMYDLGEITKLKILPYQDGYFNDIKSGSISVGDYEDIQGAKEFNVQSSHSVNTPIKKTIDLRIPYDTCSLSMELTRRKQYATGASEDTKRDDNIFLVKTTLSSRTVQGGSHVSGIDNIDQYYNISITARENLIRNGSFIKTSLYKTTELIKFVSNKKKLEISYRNQNGDDVSEFDDIQASELIGEALFVPELYEFDAYLTAGQMAILNINPHGYIAFSFESVNYQGYIKEIRTKDYNREAKYKLIAKSFIDPESNKIWEDGQNDIFEDANNQIFE